MFLNLINKIPSRISYKLAPKVLKVISHFRKFRTYTWQPFTWNNLEFNNPLGTAGGLDKDSMYIEDWWTFGPGFIEVGTVTPKAQDANPGMILDKNTTTQALWNKLGFPNKGLKHCKTQLEKLGTPHFTPIFINIGKNRETSLENAAQDYIQCINELYEFADAFVINISSPNTEGLRDLFDETHFSDFLKPIINKRNELNEHSINKPLLLKISPELNDEQLAMSLTVSCKLGVDGWILTNTSTTLNKDNGFSPSEGGTSGKPLRDKSVEFLKKAQEILKETRQGKLLVSTGGVMDHDDVLERIELGADLVQTYSALVFKGPFFFKSVFDYVKLHGLVKK